MAAVAAKSSADTARRVKELRQRHAGKSYGGGKRPYGFEPDPDARAVPPEAGHGARRGRDHRAGRRRPAEGQGALTLKAIARDLREPARGDPARPP